MKKSWNCEQCEKKFPSKYGYDRHMKVHKATTTDVENLVKKVKSKAGFGTFLRAEKVKARKEYLLSRMYQNFQLVCKSEKAHVERTSRQNKKEKTTP